MVAAAVLVAAATACSSNEPAPPPAVPEAAEAGDPPPASALPLDARFTLPDQPTVPVTDLVCAGGTMATKVDYVEGVEGFEDVMVAVSKLRHDLMPEGHVLYELPTAALGQRAFVFGIDGVHTGLVDVEWTGKDWRPSGSVLCLPEEG